MHPLVPPDPRLVGLWRRTLLVRADGTCDTETEVRWLQAGSLYVDLRVGTDVEGFAGRLERDGPWTCWRRDVDLSPPGAADEGLLVDGGGVVVETGRHEAYTEHWHREPGPAEPVAGLLLHDADSGTCAVVVRVGPHLAYADADAVVLHRATPAGWVVVLTTSPHAVALDTALTAPAWEVVRAEGDLAALPPLRTETHA